jgi:adenylate kinase
MRVFISNVDTALGHHLSRQFSHSPVTNRHEPDAEAEESTPPPPEVNDDEAVIAPVEKDTYIVHGTLTNISPNRQTEHASKPGVMVYTGDRKRDAARKEAIEKYSVVGAKPEWVESVVEVNYYELIARTMIDKNSSKNCWIQMLLCMMLCMILKRQSGLLRVFKMHLMS